MVINGFVGRSNNSPWNWSIALEVKENKLRVLPTWGSWLIRLGKPILELSSQEIKGTKATQYRREFPLPAIEINYEGEAGKGRYAISYLWKKRKVAEALESLGVPIEQGTDRACCWNASRANGDRIARVKASNNDMHRSAGSKSLIVGECYSPRPVMCVR
jgi:hypothetical protein